MGTGFKITDATLAKLAAGGFDPIFGARPLKLAIPSQLENPRVKKDTIRVNFRAGEIMFEKDAATKYEVAGYQF